MLLRIDRNPAFWRGIARHPEVEKRVLKGAPIDHVDQVVRSANNVPLAAPHGGFIFCRRPFSDDVFDLHTMFTPEGWGREVAQAARVAFRYMFDVDMRVCHTLEQQDYYRSRPPRSHGWVATSDFAEGSIGSVRSWELTRERWCASPVGRQETEHARDGRPTRDHQRR